MSSLANESEGAGVILCVWRPSWKGNLMHVGEEKTEDVDLDVVEVRWMQAVIGLKLTTTSWRVISSCDSQLLRGLVCTCD